jgi:pyrroline-5-carboxylate reductase
VAQAKIGVIGAGRMGGTLIAGLISSYLRPADIIAFDTDPKKLKALKSVGVKTAKSNREVVKKAKIILLAVKPQIISQVLEAISPEINSSHMVVSIAAGITLAYLKAYLDTPKIFRVMPNHPSLAKEGIAAFAILPGNRKYAGEVKKIFGAVGEVVEVHEQLMDAVTGLSGSGPAFVYFFVESLVEAGMDLGLSHATAKKLVLQTIAGSITMLKRTGQDPKKLIDAVASPGGTTLAGLKVLAQKEFKKITKMAVAAAAQRSKALCKK